MITMRDEETKAEMQHVLRVFTQHAKFLFVVIYVIAATVLFWEWRRHVENDVQSTFMYTIPPSFVQYHNYCVHYDLLAPPISEYERIAQILHLSANFLDDRLLDQVSNWDAPVSLSIVLDYPQQYACIISKITAYSERNQFVRRHLRVHLIYPIDWSLTCALTYTMGDCVQRAPTYQEQARYPANVARNVARMFSTTKYILIADYEHLFSKNFERDVLQIAKNTLSEDPRRALVYRIFEIEESIGALPEKKSDLYALFSNEAAVVFHSKFYKGPHEIPKLKQWFAQEESEDGIFSKDLRYDRFAWEPQFVSLSTIPLHDESFPFRIRDNTVLRWEMCRAGYHFDLLADHFMFHRGIKRSESGAPKAIQRINRPRFRNALKAFNIRMDRQYRSTKSKCPRFGE